MERRLLRLIINPAMIATWILGLWLAWHGPDSHYGWFVSGWLRAGNWSGVPCPAIM